jgi:hypothetical protein
LKKTFRTPVVPALRHASPCSLWRALLPPPSPLDHSIVSWRQGFAPDVVEVSTYLASSLTLPIEPPHRAPLTGDESNSSTSLTSSDLATPLPSHCFAGRQAYGFRGFFLARFDSRGRAVLKASFASFRESNICSSSEGASCSLSQCETDSLPGFTPSGSSSSPSSRRHSFRASIIVVRIQVSRLVGGFGLVFDPSSGLSITSSLLFDPTCGLGIRRLCQPNFDSLTSINSCRTHSGITIGRRFWPSV